MAKTTSIVVVKGGTILFENYYSGTADTLRNWASVAKSIISILVGISIELNEIPGTNIKVVEILDWLDMARIAKGVNDIEIGHLLNMTSGIAHQMGAGIGKGEIQDLLTKPLRNNPGEVFDYNNVNTNILSMIISDRSRMTTSEYARKHLFEPLGIKQYTWRAYDGYTVGAEGLNLTTRDLAKIGYLYLKKGKWENERIVPEKWVEDSTTKQISTGEAYRGKPWDYGYQWWLPQFGEYRVFHAFGVGGQFVCVIPDLDMVIAMTGEHDINMAGERMDIIPDIILPSIQKN
jgi:CubicO group peptidase (beta-lactamase class C family)